MRALEAMVGALSDRGKEGFVVLEMSWIKARDMVQDFGRELSQLLVPVLAALLK
jgi:hypothetical protein